MLQVMDIARENAVLRGELQRMHQENTGLKCELERKEVELQRLVLGNEGSAQTTSDISAAVRFWQIISGARPEEV